MSLTRSKIVDEAILLLLEGGLGEVSLRKIAARLGVRAPSLSWHIGNKENLLNLMSEQIYYSCLDALPRCIDWSEWLYEFGKALWKSQSRSKETARLIAMTELGKEQFNRMREATVSPLVDLGLTPALAMRMQASVQALVTGWTIFAQGADAELLTSALDIESTVDESLRALIAGWQARIDALSNTVSRGSALSA